MSTFLKVLSLCLYMLSVLISVDGWVLKTNLGVWLQNQAKKANEFIDVADTNQLLIITHEFSRYIFCLALLSSILIANLGSESIKPFSFFLFVVMFCSMFLASSVKQYLEQHTEKLNELVNNTKRSVKYAVAISFSILGAALFFTFAIAQIYDQSVDKILGELSRNKELWINLSFIIFYAVVLAVAYSFVFPWIFIFFPAYLAIAVLWTVKKTVRLWNSDNSGYFKTIGWIYFLSFTMLLAFMSMFPDSGVTLAITK